MPDERVCLHCGAPADASADACKYCGAKRVAREPSAGLARTGWEERLTRGTIAWGPPITVSLPASSNELVVIRSRALLDDVEAAATFRFDAGQTWAAGSTASAIGLSIRASSSDGYDVGVSIAGLVSISRYEGGKLAAWLLEPCVHDAVRDGLGATNALAVAMEGDALSVRINGAVVARVRDATRRAGAVELHVRPGSQDARVVITSLSVRGL